MTTYSDRRRLPASGRFQRSCPAPHLHPQHARLGAKRSRTRGSCCSQA